MRNAALHRHLEIFSVDASGCLTARLAAGEEVPFELCEEPGEGASLYCFRPLTRRFIHSARSRLAALESYADAVRALAECEALDAYLGLHGEVRIPADRLTRAAHAVETFLGAMFAERSEFGFEPAHFEAAYGELERAVYADHRGVTVIAPVLGIALDPTTTELALGDGLSLIRGEALAGAPEEAVWGEQGEAHVLAVLHVEETAQAGAVGLARTRFRRLLSALRLFEHGTYAIGPFAWSRSSSASAAWRMVALGSAGRVAGLRLLTIVRAGQEEELRAFWRLVGSRRGGPGHGELVWALARFEMGCERAAPLEALTDHLLALRALLEPEGSASGRLAQRLAVICAPAPRRPELAQRAAEAIDLERAAITGMASDGRHDVDAIVDEMAGHLRAILRDALCGHLDTDLCAVADALLAEAVDDAQTAVGSHRAAGHPAQPAAVDWVVDRSPLGLAREAGSVMPTRHNTVSPGAPK